MENPNPSKPHTETRLKLFFESRKGQGKDQFIELLHFILKNENEYEDGWVPFQIIKNHMDNTFTKENPIWDSLSDSKRVNMQESGKGGPTIPGKHQPALIRLLDNMKKFHLVDKKKEKDPSLKTPNQERTFYKSCGSAITDALTPIGLEKEYRRLYRAKAELSNNLGLALSIIDENGLREEYDARIEKRKAINEKRKLQTHDEVFGEITNMTPEEVQERKLKNESARKIYLAKDLEELKEERK